MSEETVILHCSPTMAGLKTGNLFACPVRDRRALDESVREMNRRLVPRGLRLLPVYCSEHRALLYMYRPRRLKEDLKNGKAREILLKRHYPAENASAVCRRMRIFRMRSGCFSGIRPRMWTDFCGTGPGRPNVWGHGRSTAMPNRPERPLLCIKSAPGCTVGPTESITRLKSCWSKRPDA